MRRKGASQPSAGAVLGRVLREKPAGRELSGFSALGCGSETQGPPALPPCGPTGKSFLDLQLSATAALLQIAIGEPAQRGSVKSQGAGIGDLL